MQLTFINQRANMQDFTRSIDIPPRGDEYDGIRKEYGDMLKNQLQKGNNGLTKRKYIISLAKASVFRQKPFGVFLVYSGSTLELYANFRKAIKRTAPAHMNRCDPLKYCFY